MFENYLAQERAANLRRAAREQRLAKQVATANRWSRIASWAQSRARRAAERLD